MGPWDRRAANEVIEKRWFAECLVRVKKIGSAMSGIGPVYLYLLKTSAI